MVLQLIQNPYITTAELTLSLSPHPPPPPTQGERGPAGPQGRHGAPGRKGAAGVVGNPGSDGEPGAIGVPGLAGPHGPPGRRGGRVCDTCIVEQGSSSPIVKLHTTTIHIIIEVTHVLLSVCV